METDRTAVLTVRAAARGVIDFSQARPFDARWWRRTRVLLSELDRTDRLETIKAQLDFELSLIGCKHLESADFAERQDAALLLIDRIQAILKPWFGTEEKSGKKKTVEGLIETYRRVIGDPRDPVFRAKLEEQYAEFKRKRLEVRPESAEARIDRLVKERDARQADALRAARTRPAKRKS